MHCRTAPLLRIEAYLRRRGIEYTVFLDDGKDSICVRANKEDRVEEPSERRRFLYFTDLGRRIELFWGPARFSNRPSWLRGHELNMYEMDAHDEVLILTRAREILDWLGWD